MTHRLIRDGLYRVVSSYLCAGFVIRDGRVVDCAPILRKNLNSYIVAAQMGRNDIALVDELE